MSPGISRKTNGVTSPPATTGRDSVERDKARSTVLDLWSLSSLEQIVPAELAPPYWSKNLIQCLVLLANKTARGEAKALLTKEVSRRRREESASQVSIYTRQFLTIGDVTAVLGQLSSANQTADLGAPAELSIVVAGPQSPESAPEDLSSPENTDNQSVSSEDERLAHSRHASRGPPSSDPDTRSSAGTGPDSEPGPASATSNKNQPPINKSGLAHPLSASSSGPILGGRKTAVTPAILPHRNSPLADPTSTPTTTRPPTVNPRPSTTGTEPGETLPHSTARLAPASEARAPHPPSTGSPARTRASPRNVRKPTTGTRPPSTSSPEPSSGNKVPASSKTLNSSSNQLSSPSVSATASKSTIALPNLSTARPTHSAPAPKPNPTVNTPNLSTGVLRQLTTASKSSTNSPKSSTTAPGPPAGISQPRAATPKPPTATQQTPTTSAYAASGNRTGAAANVAPTSEAGRNTPHLQTLPPSQSPRQTNLEPQQQKPQGLSSPPTQATQPRPASSSSATANPLQLLSQAAFRMSGAMAKTPPQHTGRPQPPQSRPASTPAAPAARPVPPAGPVSAPIPLPSPVQQPPAKQLPAKHQKQASSKKRKFSQITQEQQVREAELQLEINSAVHKRAKYRAEQATKIYETVLRETEAATTRYVKLRDEFDSIEGRAGSLEKELQLIADAYPDMFDLPAGSGRSYSSASSGSANVATAGRINSVPGDAGRGSEPNGRGGSGSNGGAAATTILPKDLASCFEFLMQSIRAKPGSKKAERDAAGSALIELDAELRLLQSEMRAAVAEEHAKRDEMQTQTDLLKGLRAKEAE